MKTEKYKEIAYIEMSMKKDGNETISHKDGSAVQRKCISFSKISFIQEVSKK